MKVIDKIAWIHIKDEKVLSTKTKGRTKFYIPGGKREKGESDEAALIREIKEELTVDLIPETISFFGIFQAPADSHPEGVVVKMQCYGADYNGTLSAASEIEKVDWLGNDDRDKISEVDQLIFDFLYEKGWID
jgi:8-oxo-dGTP pyrophosphatase MutT (NUDIX family)